MGRGKPPHRQQGKTGQDALIALGSSLRAASEAAQQTRQTIVKQYATLHRTSRKPVKCDRPPHPVVFPDHQAALEARTAIQEAQVGVGAMEIQECRNHVHLDGLAP